MNNNQVLINKIKAGDKEAFNELVVDILPSAYKMALSILKSKEFAEESLQLTLELVYISILKKDLAMTNFKAWFFRVLYTKSIDTYRKYKREQNLQLLNVDIDFSYNEPSTQAKIIESENKREVINLLKQLKEEERIPIILYYYEGFSITEISSILDINSNTIKTRMARGRRKLKKIINALQSKEGGFYEQ
ncbi:RNA polymerase sigma factor [Niallia taxi]|uniref:RNA polymerase sigma factor n=1 Tax=Niallia taxi TaxID=2499688 RepID=UPI002E22136B|nr:RNA polymerase sigma factor [Niallia taxi]